VSEQLGEVECGDAQALNRGAQRAVLKMTG